MLFLRFSSNITPRILLATASSLFVTRACASCRNSYQPNLGGGGIHMRLHGALGGEQPFGDQGLLVLEALGRHRHRDGDGIAEWVLQGEARGADAERVFFTIERHAVAARRFDISKQGVETCERLRRARFVGASDQRLYARIAELRQIGFAVGGAV